MAKLTINGKAVDAEEGATILAAARQAGIEIPAMCSAEGVPPLSSCMICVVEEANTGRILPACAAKAEEGTAIKTDSEAIRAARREAIQLLLSEHAGDCVAPCQRICPAGLDISLMMRRVAQGDFDGAAHQAAESLIFPKTLGWVCSAPCERGCHRGAYDEPLVIRMIHRRLAELRPVAGSHAPQCAASSGKKIAIVGGGVAGLAAGCVLQRRGHACRIFEKREHVGGALRELEENELPAHVLEEEIRDILRLGVELKLACVVGRDVALVELQAQYEAVLVACDGLEFGGMGMFAAMEYPMAVAAVAEGKRAADRIDRFVRRVATAEEQKLFDCRLGALEAGDRDAFIAGRGAAQVPHPREVERVEEGDLGVEAARCLHCECLKPYTCKLREYAALYGADQHVYSGARPAIAPIQRAAGVVYEAGKCIRCGLCIEIASQAQERLGLAFVGRGFNVRVCVPFNRTLAEALEKTAERCVAACPTGALADSRGERGSS